MTRNLADRYLELVKRSLLNALYPELEAQLLHVILCLSHRQALDLHTITAAAGNAELLATLASIREGGDSLVLRGLNESGEVVDRPDLRNHAEFAHTLIGRARLDQLQQAVETVLDENIPGDLLEAGVWRGGAGILMAAVLASRGNTSRWVWLADSFRGLPTATDSHDRDFEMGAELLPILAVSEAQVRQLFERYDLWSGRVSFIPGWFQDTLAAAPVGPLAVLRIDADYYSSTSEALMGLYERVSTGGIVIIDDYGLLPPCRAAVDDFRRARGCVEPLQVIDGHGVYWRKGSV